MYAVLPVLFFLVTRLTGVGSVVVIWGGSAVLARLLLGSPVGDLVVFVPCFTAGVIAYRLRRERRPAWGMSAGRSLSAWPRSRTSTTRA